VQCVPKLHSAGCLPQLVWGGAGMFPAELVPRQDSLCLCTQPGCGVLHSEWPVSLDLKALLTPWICLSQDYHELHTLNL